jgi:hypothetical protein
LASPRSRFGGICGWLSLYLWEVADVLEAEGALAEVGELVERLVLGHVAALLERAYAGLLEQLVGLEGHAAQVLQIEATEQLGDVEVLRGRSGAVDAEEGAGELQLLEGVEHRTRAGWPRMVPHGVRAREPGASGRSARVRRCVAGDPSGVDRPGRGAMLGVNRCCAAGSAGADRPCWGQTRTRPGGRRVRAGGALAGAAELAAGGHAFVAAGGADRRVEVVGLEGGLEGGDALGAGAAEFAAGVRVPGDEVELAGEALDERGEAFGVLGGVVDVGEEDVLEGDALAAAQGQVAERREQVAERVLAVDGHQPVADLLGRGIDADGQARWRGREKLLDRGDDPRRGDGHAAVRQAEALVVAQDVGRGDHVGEVVQRLAHAHEHDVGQPQVGEAAAREHDLVDHLGGRQVAREAHLGGQAELAVHGAADLARDAERGAVGLAGDAGDHDRLDARAVGCPKGQLGGAVVGGVDLVDGQDVEAGLLGEQLAERGVEVGDVGGVAD